MFLCLCWKCRDLNKVWESLGMALHVERAATVHEVHVRAFFSDTARAHSEMSRSRIIFLAHMIQQQSACIQCIHDRPNISQLLCIIYSFICFIQKHPEIWSSFFWLFPFWMILCQRWKCQDLNKIRESLGMSSWNNVSLFFQKLKVMVRNLMVPTKLDNRCKGTHWKRVLHSVATAWSRPITGNPLLTDLFDRPPNACADSARQTRSKIKLC